MKTKSRAAAGHGVTGLSPARAGGEGYRPGEPGYRRRSVALCAAGVATFALLYSTQALLPELARAFSVSAAGSTLSLSLATAGLGVALLFTGPVSEGLGRTRLIQGVALAGLPAVATAYLREEMHPGGYARTAGLYVGGNALGGMTGRLITGAVADAAGWRWDRAAGAGAGA